MRLLLADDPVRPGPGTGAKLDLQGLASLYAVPPGHATWLRVNMVSTLDGAATGADGVTGSINTAADHVVFDVLRAISDVVVVGAETARREGYRPIHVKEGYAGVRAAGGRPTALALAVVTRSGELAPRLRSPNPSAPVLAITCTRSPGLARLREAFGYDQVLVAGDDDVDLAQGLTQLADRGMRHVHSEGGPRLLGRLLAAGLVDELDLTYSPVVVGGAHQRITVADDIHQAFVPRLLVEEDGTLMGRWLRNR